MKIVKIEWVDISSGTAHWTDIDEIEPELMKCTSVGVVIRETEELICIAQNYSADSGLVADTMLFPKSVVVKIEELCEL
jgi:hypothetical protein